MKKKYIYLDGIKSRYMIYSDGRIYNTEKDIFMKDISKEIGCPYSVVTHIKYGDTWK